MRKSAGCSDGRNAYPSHRCNLLTSSARGAGLCLLTLAGLAGVPRTADAFGSAEDATPSAASLNIRPVDDSTLANPPAGDWLSWRRTPDGFGFSPLTQITRLNVQRLKLAWSWALDPGPNVSTPIVRDGVLFIQNAGDRVQALSAATGDMLWEYVRNLPDDGNRIRGKKSMAIYGDKLFVATEDEHLIALNINTGKLVWDQAVAGASEAAPTPRNYHYSAGPIIAHGKVISGISGCLRAQPHGCFIAGYNPDTGAELWRFYTVAGPGEPGGETWGNLPLDQRRGGSVWLPGTYDPDTNIIYYGTGQATPYNAYGRGTGTFPVNGKDELLYTDSTLALNPDTGKLIWYYQHLPNDTWDMDYAFERLILTIPVDGKPRKVVLTIGKLGIVEMLDARTGEFLKAKDLGFQNIVKAIDPRTGRKTIDPARWPKNQNEPLDYCPGALGARNWPATSFDPTTRTLYLPMNDHCSTATVTPLDPGEKYEGGAGSTYTYRPGPRSDGNVGQFWALSLDTMAVNWKFQERAPQGAGALATAGGVVFGGAIDRRFRAMDATTGKVLWETRLGAAINSQTITFSAGGKQFVAVLTGSNSTFASAFAGMLPEMRNPPGVSGMLWVFSLE